MSKKHFYMLLAVGIGLSLVMLLFGRDLLSVWISVVCAYLLKRPYKKLISYGLPETLACSLVIIIFMIAIVLLLFVIIPPMLTEAYNFLNSLPKMLSSNQENITHFIDKIYANIPNIGDLIANIKQYLSDKSTNGLLLLINLVPATFELMLYFFLVPIMLFFLIKDSNIFCNYFTELSPNIATAVKDFWQELDKKLGSYLQGKIIELIIVGLSALILYSMFALKYALLVAGLMAVSVFIPVVGAIIATIPLLLIGLWQFGIHDSKLIYLIITHATLLIVDSNILVPILFSEKLNLHPLVILIGILFFGSLFGFWGLFFAIPILIIFSLIIKQYKLTFLGNSL